MIEEAGFLERESRFHERGGQKSSLFRINEQIVVRSEMEEIDFDSLIKGETREAEEVNIKKDVIEMESSEVIRENALKRLFNKVKMGFSYILSWGL